MIRRNLELINQHLTGCLAAGDIIPPDISLTAKIGDDANIYGEEYFGQSPDSEKFRKAFSKILREFFVEPSANDEGNIIIFSFDIIISK